MNLPSTHLSNLFHTRKFIVHLLIISILVITAGIVAAQEVPATIVGKPGRISGVVFDSKSGEKLPGVTIMVQLPSDTIAQVQSMGGKTVSLGAKSNLNGEYLVRSVPPGIYTISVTMIGYAKSVISDVEVTPDGLAKLDVALSTKEVTLGNDIEVTGKRGQETVSATDIIRKKATSTMDFVSKEQISRSGAGDAQGAIAKVTGVSLMNNQAYVRGLSDRYINVQVDGSTMPTSDPDKQTFRFDIFASSLLDNISVQKTATPDQPGNFTGANINLSTKDFPEARQLSFSSSMAYDNLASLNNSFATYQGSDGDVWGYDSGTRDLPQYVKENIDRMPGTQQLPIVLTEEKRRVGDSVLNMLSNDVEPTTRKSPLNRNFNIEFGDNLLLFSRPLGVTANAIYTRSFSYYDDGHQNRYVGSFGATETRPLKLREVEESKDEVTTNLQGKFAYSLTDNHEIKFQYSRVQTGETTTRFGSSWEQSSLEVNQRKASSNLLYTERSNETFQLRGGHQLFRLANSAVKLDWSLSKSTSIQDDPDNRRFVEFLTYNEDGTVDTTVNPYTSPTTERYWRYMNEQNREAKVDLTVPVDSWLKLKAGYNLLQKHRVRETYEFQLVNEDRSLRVVGKDSTGSLDTVYFEGDWEQYIDQAGGVLLFHDSTLRSNGTYSHTYYWGLYYSPLSNPENSYTGDQTIPAWYGMADIFLFNKFKISGGVRREKTEMEVYAMRDNTIVTRLQTGETSTYMAGDKMTAIDVTDWLPSVNAIYSFNDKMNLRGAASKTLARPSLRELSPARDNSFPEADEFYGNVELTRSLINNYDLRWEWFVRPGEILSVGGFAKKFKDPIEWGFRGGGTDPVVIPENVESGTLYGVEFEVRKRLDLAGKLFRYFTLGGNLTVATSKVDLSSRELQFRKDAGLPTERPLQGQPSSVANIDLTYQNPKLGTRLTVLYNHVADQLYINSANDIPDVYEEARSTLDITAAQTLFAGLRIGLSAKNLTDEPLIRYYKLSSGTKVLDIGGNTVDKAIYESYSKGVSFSAGLTWQIW